MTPYLAILSARFRMLLQYRAAALAGLGTQLFWGLIRVMVYEAFYRSSSAPQPMSLEDTVTYLWLTQAMLHLIPFRLDAEIGDGPRRHAGLRLARPMDLYWAWYARASPCARRPPCCAPCRCSPWRSLSRDAPAQPVVVPRLSRGDRGRCS